MPPRSQPLPQPTTDSAREARKAFFCDLCQKGYARMNDYESHEMSYDHQHRKRLKEMRTLTKDPNAAARQKAAEERANAAEGGMKSISLTGISGSRGGGGGSVMGGSGGGGGGVKKKPVFKSTLQAQNAAIVLPKAQERSRLAKDPRDLSRAVRNGWKEDAYDPERPTQVVELDEALWESMPKLPEGQREYDRDIAERSGMVHLLGDG